MSVSNDPNDDGVRRRFTIDSGLDVELPCLG